MATSDKAVGMMDPAYFTSRKQILDWLNSLLCLNLTKIEQTASGAVACQLCEYIYPASLNIAKVNWNATSAPEYVSNYKLLQQAFNKNNVQRYVDVDKLIREKYQDNLEFMQWFKAFFDQCCPSYSSEGTKVGYDPESVRLKGKGGKDSRKNFEKKAKAAGSKLLPGDRVKAVSEVDGGEGDGEASFVPSADAAAVVKRTPIVPSQKREVASNVREVLKDSTKRTTSANATSRLDGSKSSLAAQKNDIRLQKDHENLKKDHASLRTTVEGLEKERDFYFDKLRDIEIMLQTFQESPSGLTICAAGTDGGKLIDGVFEVLYATTEDGISVSDDGVVVRKNEAKGVEEGGAKGVDENRAAVCA